MANTELAKSTKRASASQPAEVDCEDGYEDDTQDSFDTSSYADDDERSQASRDEKRARALNIPIPTPEIINLPIDEFNERLAKFDLSEAQLSLIRDIRRRGKNKVAAQNCRKRKMDQIVGLQGEVDVMFSQKEALQRQQDQLLLWRQMARDKYANLYQFILDASTRHNVQSFTSENPPEYPGGHGTDPSRPSTSGRNGRQGSSHHFLVAVGSSKRSDQEDDTSRNGR
jgi:hypothetical protein